jgi:hypothetical protein
MAGPVIGCENEKVKVIDVYIKTGAGIRYIVNRSGQGEDVVFMNKIGNPLFG